MPDSPADSPVIPARQPSMPAGAPPPSCTCGAPLFRENTTCLRCRALVGFLPDQGWLLSFTALPDGTFTNSHPSLQNRVYKTCANRTAAPQCNWMIATSDAGQPCLSCSLTRTTPNPAVPEAAARWTAAEHAKRHVLIQLLRHRLPVRSRHTHPDGVWFDFLQPLPGGPPVLTGHQRGLITINLSEADPAQRALIQEKMGESYRTLTGHMRHELAHYYWERFSTDAAWLQQCRSVFGDDRQDYAAALATHHRQGPPPQWASRFISAYASSHPWEDWAETFAHYLHMDEALHTAQRLGLDLRRLKLRTDSFDHAALFPSSPAADPAFLDTIDRWVLLSLTANEINAALGHPLAYPFILNSSIVTKLHAIHQSFQHFAAPPMASPLPPNDPAAGTHR